MSEAVILTCGWCRTIIPGEDEVQHHFLVAHGQAVDHSVRYRYPERLSEDVERWLAVACSDTKEGR